MDAAESPVLSVIVPVRDGAEFLPRCLAALRASRNARWPWELIVVDDASRDGSAAIAEALADRVVRLTTPVRPAAARNHGAAAARGRILVFVDADVCVHPAALEQMHDFLSDRPDISAVFGAYDVTPAAPGFVSQYRNLLHHYVHHREAGETATFWTGLGAIRREAFERVGRFDERQQSLEDVELGYRLCAEGYRIVLRPEIQGTHLKRWTFGRMIVADVRDRGVPWTRLLLSRRGVIRRPTLNVRAGEQVLTGLMGLAAVFAMAALLADRAILLAPAVAAVGLMLVGDRRFQAWLAEERGWWFALRAVPLRVLYYALNVLSIGVALLSLGRGHAEPGSTRVPVVRPAP
jgi:glycosyltransferase involved in cell wall biosynthesis